MLYFKTNIISCIIDKSFQELGVKSKKKKKDLKLWDLLITETVVSHG